MELSKYKFIMNETQTYLQTQGKSLEERLDSIKISENKKKSIVIENSTKIIRDKILGYFPLGNLITTFINWNDEINRDINMAKKAYLLETYLNKVDSQEDAINKLLFFLTNPEGIVLFNKILSILDENPPDKELIDHLSSALKYIISDAEFYKLFEEHKFILSQIEKLTPQALTLLADYRNFPKFQLNSVIMMGEKISSEWVDQFVQEYCKKKNISYELITRISHVITDLQTKGYLEAKVYESQTKTYICELSSMGQDLFKYIADFD